MNTQEEIEILQTYTSNIDNELDNCKQYVSELGATVKELLEILHKATNTKRFEEMKQEFIEYRGEFR